MKLTIPITFITPCFCRGINNSDKGTPEIRPSSIRGQLHWWLRVLGYDATMESAIFGCIGKISIASPLVVRVSEVDDLQFKTFPTLPHKQGGSVASKLAITPDSTFNLLISTRLKGLNDDQKLAFTRALDAWLHMGTLGLRATRAAGSFYWESQPLGINQWEVNLQKIVQGTSLKVSVLNASFQLPEDARLIVSDTIGGRNDRRGKDSLRSIQYPLGNMSPRKTSPLRFRIVAVGKGDFRILAIWDGRKEVTGNDSNDLTRAIELLSSSGKTIGFQMRDARWIAHK